MSSEPKVRHHAVITSYNFAVVMRGPTKDVPQDDFRTSEASSIGTPISASMLMKVRRSWSSDQLHISHFAGFVLYALTISGQVSADPLKISLSSAVAITSIA